MHRVQRGDLVALRHNDRHRHQALPDFVVQHLRPHEVAEIVQQTPDVAVFVGAVITGFPLTLVEGVLADKSHAGSRAVVVIVQLDELGGLGVFVKLQQASRCQIGK